MIRVSDNNAWVTVVLQVSVTAEDGIESVHD